MAGGLDNANSACYADNAMKPNNAKGRIVQLRNFDEEVLRQVKAAAALEEKTMSDWIEEACREKLASEAKAGKKSQKT